MLPDIVDGWGGRTRTQECRRITCGAVSIYARFIAAAAAVQFAVITFVAHWPQGFTWSRGGWEYPLFWGLILFAIALRGGGPYSVDRKLGWEL